MKKNVLLTRLMSFLIGSIVVLLSTSVTATQESKVSLPVVANANVPLYPPVARHANVEGVVRLKVTTDGHIVAAVQVLDGPRLLADAAEGNIRTWRFQVHEPTTLTVTYTYKLVTEWKGDPNNPIVVFHFPTDVEVSTRRWPGTVDMPSRVTHPSK